MNIALWVCQGILAALFLASGSGKVLTPREKLEPRMAWVKYYPDIGVKAIGTAEILGALGLILPWATGIAKVLTPIAAVGLAIVMVGAIFTHLRLKEPWYAQLVFFAVAVFVAAGRF